MKDKKGEKNPNKKESSIIQEYEVADKELKKLQDTIEYYNEQIEALKKELEKYKGREMAGKIQDDIRALEEERRKYDNELTAAELRQYKAKKAFDANQPLTEESRKSSYKDLKRSYKHSFGIGERLKQKITGKGPKWKQISKEFSKEDFEAFYFEIIQQRFGSRLYKNVVEEEEEFLSASAKYYKKEQYKKLLERNIKQNMAEKKRLYLTSEDYRKVIQKFARGEASYKKVLDAEYELENKSIKR